ncbi:MAG: hypothetical protein KC609_06820 [Myxococcales bacterium]|nr:hypothetical protein [Myxococcales bacterium]
MRISVLVLFIVLFLGACLPSAKKSVADADGATSDDVQLDLSDDLALPPSDVVNDAKSDDSDAVGVEDASSDVTSDAAPSDALADGGGGDAIMTLQCPGGSFQMALIDNEFCVDKYELNTIGAPEPPVAGVTPTSEFKIHHFRDGCKTIGKRLCTLEELARACMGKTKSLYPYGYQNGDTFDLAICKGDQSGVHLTGALPQCVTSEGVFDLVGNVWETLAWNDADKTTKIFGGDFRGDKPFQSACCIRIDPKDPFPKGCEAFYDENDPYLGANVTEVPTPNTTISYKKDVLGREISLGYRCCWDPSLQ